MSDYEKLEAVAALAHRQWCNWARYMLDNLTEENKVRWYKQIDTSYLELPETQKDSDRAWAALYLFLLSSDHLDTTEEDVNMEQAVYKQINNILSALAEAYGKDTQSAAGYHAALTHVKAEVDKLQKEHKVGMDEFGAGLVDI